MKTTMKKKDGGEDDHDKLEVDDDVGNSSNSGSSHTGPRMCGKQKLGCATGQTAGARLTQQSAKYCLYMNWDDQQPRLSISHPTGLPGFAGSFSIIRIATFCNTHASQALQAT